MSEGQLEVKKYESVSHDEHFGTPFAHLINFNHIDLSVKRCT